MRTDAMQTEQHPTHKNMSNYKKNNTMKRIIAPLIMSLICIMSCEKIQKPEPGPETGPETGDKYEVLIAEDYTTRGQSHYNVGDTGYLTATLLKNGSAMEWDDWEWTEGKTNVISNRDINHVTVSSNIACTSEIKATANNLPGSTASNKIKAYATHEVQFIKQAHSQGYIFWSPAFEGEISRTNGLINYSQTDGYVVFTAKIFMTEVPDDVISSYMKFGVFDYNNRQITTIEFFNPHLAARGSGSYSHYYDGTRVHIITENSTAMYMTLSSNASYSLRLLDSRCDAEGGDWYDLTYDSEIRTDDSGRWYN